VIRGRKYKKKDNQCKSRVKKMRKRQTIVRTILHRKLQIRTSLKNEIISPVVKCRSQMAITVLFRVQVGVWSKPTFINSN